MRGDFSRSTFNPNKRYSSVRLQQGRVQIDADWNEQIDILTSALATYLGDTVGPSGVHANGFAISDIATVRDEPATDDETSAIPTRPPPDFTIGAGRCYVEGSLCENPQAVRFSTQPDYPGALARVPRTSKSHYLVYLDGWQRQITALEDPNLLEVALAGADTATRTRMVSQVKLEAVDLPEPARAPHDWQAWLHDRFGDQAQLEVDRDPSKLSLPDNYLYRIEIHSVSLDRRSATFKWSRQNGAVTFAIAAEPEAGPQSSQLVVPLAGLGRSPFDWQSSQWVELVSDDIVLGGTTLALCKVPPRSVEDSEHITVCAASATLEQLKRFASAQHPQLCFWDQYGPQVDPDSGCIAITPGQWQPIEHGLQIKFSQGGSYQVGDYWQIPARVDAGLLWPGEPAQPPHGIAHHYAPLALLQWEPDGWRLLHDYRSRYLTLDQLTDSVCTLHRQHEQAQQRIADLQAEIDRLEQQTAAEIARVEQSIEARIDAALARRVNGTGMFQEFRATQHLEVGDVVTFASADQPHADDDDAPARVSRAEESFVGLVIGVVAYAPPHHHADSFYSIALYGRVKCKVRGHVRPGDLLVPSASAGCARRAGIYIKPGTLIGKALQAAHPAHPAHASLIDILVMLT